MLEFCGQIGFFEGLAHLVNHRLAGACAYCALHASRETAYDGVQSQVSGNTVTIESGGDTTIQGGVVKGDQVTAKVGTNPFGSGGNLNIENLQDKSQYNEKSQQVGGSVTFGPAAGGSLNVGQTKINSDYLSVGEQSAIRAGDGEFTHKSVI